MKSCSRCYAVVNKIYDTVIFREEEKVDKNNICWRCVREFENNPNYTFINAWEKNK